MVMMRIDEDEYDDENGKEKEREREILSKWNEIYSSSFMIFVLK